MTEPDSSQPAGESPIEAQLAAPPASHHSVHVAAAKSSSSGKPSSSQSELIQSRGAVLAALFLVTGALGIPLLWMNHKFSNVERIVWTIIVTIYTIILVLIVWAIVMWSYRQIFG
jgi:cobalamin synthase